MCLRRRDDLIQNNITPGLDQERKTRRGGSWKIRDKRRTTPPGRRSWGRGPLEGTASTGDTGDDVSTAIAIEKPELVPDFPREGLVGRQQPRLNFDLLSRCVEEFDELIHSTELSGKIRDYQRIPSRILDNQIGRA